MLKRITEALNNFFESPIDRRMKHMEAEQARMRESLGELVSIQREMLKNQVLHLQMATEANRESRDTYRTIADILRRQLQIGPHL